MIDHRDLLIPAIGLIVLAVLLEWGVATRRGHQRSVAWMLSNGWVALVEQGAGLLLYTGVFGLYAALAAYAPFPWPQERWATWIVTFVLVDLAFYAYHRFSHATALGWSVHVVHHQSPELNFTAALRNSPLGGTLQFVFHAPLALIGVPPLCWIVAKSVNPLWQLLLHTELVGRLPFVEGVLNTPAAHRVHHGIQPRYQGRNMGGLLMIWDRLFGTWAEESEPVRYGEHASLDPLSSQLRPLGILLSTALWRGPAVLLGPGLSVESGVVEPVPVRSVMAVLHLAAGVAVLVAMVLGPLPWVAGIVLLSLGALTAAPILGAR